MSKLRGASTLSAINYRIQPRARELLEDLPEPLTLSRIVGEVIKTRREMNRILRSRYL